jgi:hypothetical protein
MNTVDNLADTINAFGLYYEQWNSVTADGRRVTGQKPDPKPIEVNTGHPFPRVSVLL